MKLNYNNSIYKPPRNSKLLKNQNYIYTDNGLYCYLEHFNQNNTDIYLKISRGDNSYEYSIVSFHEKIKQEKLTKKIEDKIKQHGYIVTSQKPITFYDEKRNRNLGICTKRLIKIIDPLVKITTDLNNTKGFEQITAEFKKYKEIQENITSFENEKTYDNEIATEVENKIMEKGLITYLTENLNKIHIGSKKNIIRKILAGFNIIRGVGSYLFETTGSAEAGKSYEDEIVFFNIMPKESVIYYNDITYANFTRMTENNPDILNHKIMYMGDWGAKDKIQDVLDVLNVLKILITEKRYKRGLNENKENKDFLMEVESIGAVYQTTATIFSGDDQLESRTIESSPENMNVNNILDFIDLTRYNKLSKENYEAKNSKKELKKLQHYLKKLAYDDDKIIHTSPYHDLLKKYATRSKKPIREYQQLRELFDSYCILTFSECENHKGKLVPSMKQVQDFLNEILLENPIKPTYNEFIKMLLNKGDKLKPLDVDDREHLNEYFNNILEELNFDHDSYKTWYELEDKDKKKAIRKLLSTYGIAKQKNINNTLDEDRNIFFTVSRIKRVYKNHSAFKSVDDISNTLDDLNHEGYLSKLEEKDESKQNIYYLTTKSEKLQDRIKLKGEDKKKARQYEKDHFNV